jgi:hypothetical protein
MSGFYDGTDYANKTFYGFKLIQATGQLSIDVINDGTATVSLPQSTYILAPNQYVSWVWSTDVYQFRWGTNGHLEMVFI